LIHCLHVATPLAAGFFREENYPKKFMPDPDAVDFSLVILANIVNVLVIGIVIFRTARKIRLERFLRLLLMVAILPVGAAIIINVVEDRPSWSTLLPVLFLLYLASEVVFFYILRRDVSGSRWFGFYLVIYYAGLLGMIGYAMKVGEILGFITLTTYFFNILASRFSFSRLTTN
jgi:hypothetical protein